MFWSFNNVICPSIQALTNDLFTFSAADTFHEIRPFSIDFNEKLNSAREPSENVVKNWTNYFHLDWFFFFLFFAFAAAAVATADVDFFPTTGVWLCFRYFSSRSYHSNFEAALKRPNYVGATM